MRHKAGCKPDVSQDMFGLQPLPKPLGCGRIFPAVESADFGCAPKGTAFGGAART